MRRIDRRRCLGGIAAGILAVGSGPGTAGRRSARAEAARRAPPIKLAQVGVGHAHASKLSVYRESPDYEVIGIVEPDEGLRRAAESQAAYRGLPWLTLEEVLNQEDLRVVLVETRVRDSLGVAEQCIAAGKHIHLDKPAGESLPHYRKILTAAERAGLMIQMGYMYRYNPAVVLMRDLLRRGWLGEPFEVQTVMSKVVDPGSRRGLAEYPGGIMFELGCHVVDLVIGALGRPDSVHPFPQRVPQDADQLVDNMLAVFRYPKALASVKSSALEVDGFERRHFTLCGTLGTIHIQPLDNPKVRLTLTEPRGEFRQGYQEISIPKYTRYVGDAADMARVVRGEKQNDFSYAHDLAVQETLLQACGLAT